MSAEEQKAEFVSRAKLSEQAERYDDMAEFMRKVTESGLGKQSRDLNTTGSNSSRNLRIGQ